MHIRLETLKSQRFTGSIVSAGDRAAGQTRVSPFQSEIARYCSTLMMPPPGGPPMKLVYQAARFDICLHMIANYMLWNHAAHAVPTLAALKGKTWSCDRQVAAYVAMLRQRRLISVRPLACDRRVLILEPSATLVLEVARHPLATARSFARLTGHAPPPPPSPVSAARFIAAALRAGILTPRPAIYPKIAALARHDCGYLILLAIMLAHYERTDQPPSLAYAALAERFDVSKTHVANIFRHGRATNLFKIERGGRLDMVSADLVHEFESLMALQMYTLGVLARRLASAATDGHEHCGPSLSGDRNEDGRRVEITT